MQFGEGGEDSKIFVDQLSGVYLKYASLLGFERELMGSSNGHMTLRFSGPGV